MPTTILDGETYEQARHRRFTEEAKVIEKIQQDEIIRMAREAGALVFQSNFCGSSFDFNSEQLERFFHLAFTAGADHEREACAKVCEDYIDRLHKMRDNDESLPQYQPELAGRQAGAGRCAAAIRARGES